MKEKEPETVTIVRTACNAEAGTFDGKILRCGYAGSFPDGRCGIHTASRWDDNCLELAARKNPR